MYIVISRLYSRLCLGLELTVDKLYGTTS